MISETILKFMNDNIFLMIVLFVVVLEFIYIWFITSSKKEKHHNWVEHMFMAKWFAFIMTGCSTVIFLFIIYLIDYWKEILSGLAMILGIVGFFVINYIIARVLGTETKPKKRKKKKKKK